MIFVTQNCHQTEIGQQKTSGFQFFSVVSTQKNSQGMRRKTFPGIQECGTALEGLIDQELLLVSSRPWN